MLLNGNSHVQGIFKYSDDIAFEKDDFVVEGNCIYICTAAESIKGKLPSKNPNYYTAYPGDKITTAQEYYDYLNNRSNGEDKYVSAYALCDILENMYFGFGDNGLITDHVIYNPAEGIEYSIRSVREPLDNNTPSVLNKILQTEDLNNGLVKISRNITEISDILQENYNEETFISDVVILRQYTYFDTTKETKFRIQELIDPERNKIYFRFSKGEVRENITYFNSASPWKNIYSNNEEIRNKLNTIEEYYRSKTLEVQDLYNRLKGKYCYRNVEINEPGTTIDLLPGGTKDIKSVESFLTKSCFLDVIIKSLVDGSENLYKNYSITIDTKDIVEANNNTESYQLNDGIVLTGRYFRNSGGYETIELEVPNGCIIKDVYYRDYTLGHIHEWRLDHVEAGHEATCSAPGWGTYVCDLCGETKEDTIAQLQHNMEKHEGYSPTCNSNGQHTYFTCSNEPGVYYQDEYGTATFTGMNEGDYPIIIANLGTEHEYTDWVVISEPTCTTDGLKERRCTICGHIEQITQQATGHDTREVPRHEATCGISGNITYYVCSNCRGCFTDQAATTQISFDDTIILPTGQHNINEETDNVIVLIEPTYTDVSNPHKGTGLIQCPNCEHYIEVELDYKRHDLDRTHTELHEHSYEFHPATCTDDEYEEGWCLDCNERRINYNFGTALGHTVYKEPNNENYIKDCSNIDAHPYGYWKGDRCTRCGATGDIIEYNTNDPVEHEINIHASSTQYRPSSCNRSAYWEGTCIHCERTHVSIDDNEHGPVGHIDRDEDNTCDIDGCNVSWEHHDHN